MPDNSNKNQTASKNEPKDQRKPRQGKSKATLKANEKKAELAIKAETDKKYDIVTRSSTKVKSEPMSKEEVSGNDDTLNISEDSDGKYKKKEITSNWAKYDAPIETYEEYEELEDMGSDYEKLILASMSVGGHFQFKHEKSWNTSTAPSLYDKYFDIYTDDLAIALSTIPFYERNCIDKTLFVESEITNMDGRTTRFKQKYNNENPETPDLAAKIIGNLKEESISKDCEENIKESPKEITDVELKVPFDSAKNENDKIVGVENVELENKSHFNESETNHEKEELQDIDDIIFGKVSPNAIHSPVKKAEVTPALANSVLVADKIEESVTSKAVENPVEKKSNPVVAESPEDLEKWLDNFLDG